MKFKTIAACGLTIATLGVALQASAHRAWMLPSATVFSGDSAWLTMDGAVSNSLFYFEHHPLALDNLQIVSPSGASVTAQNIAKATYRSTFDVELIEDGTYTLQIENSGAFASYKLNGERKRWRGSLDKIDDIPKQATDVKLSESGRRMQVFVTKGNPSSKNFKLQGKGLELLPITHPNDLFAGELAEFKLLIDGNAASRLDVVLIPGGIRYRNQVNELKATTNAEGIFSVTWPSAGMYWLEAETEIDSVVIKGGKRRLSYSATLEVLPL